MTLIKSLQRHFVFAIATFFLLSGSAYAKKHKLSGQVLDPEQERVKGAEIAFILDGNIEKEVKTDRKGKFKEKLDPRKYNGAIFLGLNGPVVKSHGSTDALGFSYSIEVCYKIAKGNMMKKIKDNLNHIKKINDEKREYK